MVFYQGLGFQLTQPCLTYLYPPASLAKIAVIMQLALEKEMATHSSVLAWRIPGTGEPGGLPSMGSHRVRHDWSDLAAAVTRKDCNMYTWRVRNIKAHRETFADTGCLQFKGLIWPGVARGETKERTAPQLRFSSGQNLCFLTYSEIQSICLFHWPVHPSVSSLSRLRFGSSDKQ